MKLLSYILAVLAIGGSVWAADDVEGFQAAAVHLQKGRYDEALEAYAELEKAEGDPANIALGSSRAYAATGQWKKATAVLESAVTKLPKSADVRADLAKVHLQRGRYAQAEKLAEAALKLDPDQALARLVLADAYVETGQIKKADDAYRWFVRYYNRVQPEAAEPLMMVARGAVQYARWHSVSQIYDFIVNTLCVDALKADENHWQAHHISGAMLLEKYNRAQALPDLQKALAVNPRSTDVLVSLAAAAFQRQEKEQAEEYALRALKVDAGHVGALRVQADIRLADGKLSDALMLLEKALETNPHDQHTLSRIAACFVLIDGWPSDERLDTLFSGLEQIDKITLKNPSRFETLVVELARRNPHPGYFLNDLASALEARRKYDVAERLYKQAIATMPQLSGPKTALGMLYMRVGKNEKAKRILDDAFKADPFHVRVSNMRKVLGVLAEYRTITTDHFVIRVDSKLDRVLGEYMAEYLEEIYPDLVKQFGFEPPQRTHFEIFNNAKGLSGHQWFSARMIGLPWIQTIGASTGVIVALASPTAAETPFNWARVLKHEFVHVITLQQTKFNIPHWFTEALAVSAEGYARPAVWNRLLLERVPSGDLRTLANLNDGFTRPKSALDWQFAYCQSRLYAQYMVEKYGAECIPKLLTAYRDGLPTERAIPKVFAVDVATFEKGYRAFLDKVVFEIQASLPAKKKSPAEIEKAYLADPDNSRNAAEYAASLLEQRNPTKARELATKSLEKNEREPVASVVMAKLALRAEDVDMANAHLEKALDRKKPHREVLALLASLKLRQEQFDEAGVLYELGRKTFTYDDQWLKGAAAVHLITGNEKQLVLVLEQLAARDADDVLVRKRLTVAKLKTADYTGAARYGREAIYIDVLDAEIHRMLAEAHRGLKQPARAVRESEVALSLKPGNDEIELDLARSLLAVGMKKAARQRIENILERRPDHAGAKALLETLN
jgi:tetratricopeptide (TPR) repeat protein